jgi:phospholipase C
MKLKRRSVLKGLGAAALTPALPGCDPSVSPMAVTPALLRERIKTVVVLMMENRSFDHVFGALSLEEGRDDIDGMHADFSNLRSDGVVVKPTPADVACLEDPGHGWGASHAQWNDGRNDGFVLDYEERAGLDGAHRCMGYLNRAIQPASYALADQFALCQRWHCSVLGPTWPNRYYSQLASSDGNHSNDLIADQTLPTVYQRLDQARVPWSSYYGNIPFSSILPNHSIEADEYQRLDQFFEDAAAGALRSVVWLDPIYGRADDHPPAHPLAGQTLIASVYEALRQSPQWGECLLLITYDEHGGFFDHVAPPEVEDVRAADGFTHMGFRVPTMVIGPYVKPQVSNTVFDHTSIIASLLRLHDLEPLNVRDDNANDVFSLLDEDRLLAKEPRAGEKLPTFEVDENEIYADECVSGLPFHISVDETFTGQPELDRAFSEKFGANHPKDLRNQMTRSMRLLVERARALGVLR